MSGRGKGGKGFRKERKLTLNISNTLIEAYKWQKLSSTIKCRISLGTLFLLLCNLVCVHAFATLQMCVCIGSQYLQKILEKHCKTLASLDFANFFLEIFANISILYTHIFSVAKAFTQTKLHSSENKVPSSILHLIVENTILKLKLMIQTHSM